MIHSFRIGNFKAFADTQGMPIRPLTLIYGPNSAGKSSILHGLALAHHATQTGELDVHRTDIGGDSIDLGGFRQYVHRRDSSRSVELTIEIDTARLSGPLAELFARARSVGVQLLIGESQRHGVAIQVASVLADDAPVITMSARAPGSLRVDRVEHSHPIFRETIKSLVLFSTTTDELSEEDFAGVDELVGELIPRLVVNPVPLFPRMLSKTAVEDETREAMLQPVSRSNRAEDLRRAIAMYLPRTLREIVNGVSDAIQNALLRLQYLAPLRSYPPRHLAFSSHHDLNWKAGGGQAWDVLRRDAGIRAIVNEWLRAPGRLQTPYELVLRSLVPLDAAQDVLERVLEETDMEFEVDYGPEGPESGYEVPVPKSPESYLQRFSQDMANIESVGELTLIDRNGTPLSHRDVGVGISQVLPVLVSAYGHREQLIAIEQPEIHLHPALQAELGDVFIESALGERRNFFLLETHSEHLLLRIMRRMRQTATKNLPDGAPSIRPEDVMVLYVEPDGSRSIIRQMPLNEQGELVKAWPGGFFEEGLREVF